MSVTLTRKQALAIREALADARAMLGATRIGCAPNDDDVARWEDRAWAALKALPAPTPAEVETLRCERDQLRLC